jgi:hypothetical protein
VRGFLDGAEPLIATLSYLPDVPGAEGGQTHTTVFSSSAYRVGALCTWQLSRAGESCAGFVWTGRSTNASGNISIIATFLLDLFSPLAP